MRSGPISNGLGAKIQFLALRSGHEGHLIGRIANPQRHRGRLMERVTRNLSQVRRCADGWDMMDVRNRGSL